MTAPKVGALSLEKVQGGTRTVSVVRWIILNARGEEAAYCQTEAAARSVLAPLAAAEAECARLRAALDEVNKLAWYPEADGRPSLPPVDRWRIVELCRDAALADREGVKP